MTSSLAKIVSAATSCLVTLICGASLVQAADPVWDADGFQRHRGYSTGFAGESVDTYTGNLILSYVDLDLPGNAGKPFRFGRIYNSKTGLWQVGPLDLVVAVDPHWNGPLTGLVATARTLTGGMNSLAWNWSTELIDVAGLSVGRYVASQDFWILDRLPDASGLLTLYLPDGTINRYEAPADAPPTSTIFLLKDSRDPFGNTITRTGGLTASQEVWVQGHDYVPLRTVTISYDHPVAANPSFRRPTALHYQDGGTDRSWTYAYDPDLTCCSTHLVDAIPPPGTLDHWRYGYGQGQLTRITTPWGGIVDLEYAQHEFKRDVGTSPNDPCTADNQNVCRVESTVVTRRTTSGRNITPGQWDYHYLPTTDPDPTLAMDMTTVSDSSGTESTFFFGPVISPIGLDYRVRHRVTVGSNASEEEVTSYTYPPVSPLGGLVPGGAELGTVALSRDGITYTTQYIYDTADLAHPGQFHRPNQIVESSTPAGFTRTTTRTYDYQGYNLTPNGQSFIAGKPKTESVTVNASGSFQSAWTFNPSTGFLQSETIHGIRTTFSSDANGNVAHATKANGTSTEFHYSGGVVSDIITAGHTTTRVINPDGTVASEARRGQTAAFQYDNLGRTVFLHPPQGNDVTTTYAGDGTSVTVARGSTVVTTYLDGFGRPIGSSNSANLITVIGYDGLGRTTFESLPYQGNPGVVPGTQTEYDGLGRVRARTTRGTPNAVIQTDYVSGTGEIRITDALNRVTTQTWRAFGSPSDARLVRVTDATNHAWDYEYNTLGSLTKVTAPRGELRTWQYDSTTGLLLQETHPESGAVVYDAYDAAGNLRQKHDARGTTFLYVYDGNDRIASVTAGSRVTTMSYEPNSDQRVGAVVTVGGQVAVSSAFHYDAAGRLDSRSDVLPGFAPQVQTLAYDGNDNVIRTTYASNRVVEYSYDAANRLTRVLDTSPGNTTSHSKEYASNFDYSHVSGALTAFRTGNTLAHAFNYDPLRYWPTQIASGNLLNLTYGGYDAVGNVGSIQDSRPAMTQAFAYDALDRLTAADGPYGQARYDYWPEGNRQSNAYGSYSYDAGLHLVTQGLDHFTYDANGNLKTGPLASYDYTPDNQLEASNVGGVTATYTYDGDGWRIAKTAGGRTSLFLRGAGGQLMTERLGGTTRDYIYAGSRLIAMVVNETGQPEVPSMQAQLTVSGQILQASFTASSPISTPLAGAQLMRAAVASPLCVAGATAGCSWAVVDSQAAPVNVTTWTDNASLTDAPPAGGSFVYTVQVVDADGATGMATPVNIETTDEAPDTFGFTNQTGISTGTVVTSDVVPITGIAGSVAISISGGGSYRVCTTTSCSTNPAFVTGASTITNASYLQLRLTSASAFNTAVSTTMTIGTGSATWSVTTGTQDTTPNPFTFTDQTSVAASTVITSNILTIAGVTGNVATTITGGSYRVCADASCAANPSFITGAATIANGQYLQVRVTSSTSFGVATNVIMVVGTVNDTWSVTTGAQDTTPDTFSFPSRTNVALHSNTYSDCVQVTGISGAVPVSIGGGPEVYLAVLNDAACTSGPGWISGTSTTMTNGQYLKLNVISSNLNNTTASRTITVGTYTTTWAITTLSDPCADAPAPGTTCADGSKFAGYHPTFGTKMYTTPNDYGWQPFGWPEVIYGQGDWWDGRFNTNALGTTGTNAAASACYYLNTNGKDDWYLPSPGEWNTIDNYRYDIGGFEADDQSYWTSLEFDGGDWAGGFYHVIGGSFNGYTGQGLWFPIRCIRRD